jgi:peptide/nickel transport system substrate-binding protein
VQRDSPSVREAARSGTTDLVLKDWFADYPDAENFLYPLLHSANKGVGGNVSFYQNAGFDSLVTKARREQDPALRASLYRAADSTAHVDAPMVTLFFYKELYAVQPWVTNFQVPTVFNGQRWTTVGANGSR